MKPYVIPTAVTALTGLLLFSSRVKAPASPPAPPTPPAPPSPPEPPTPPPPPTPDDLAKIQHDALVLSATELLKRSEDPQTGPVFMLTLDSDKLRELATSLENAKPPEPALATKIRILSVKADLLQFPPLAARDRPAAKPAILHTLADQLDAANPPQTALAAQLRKLAAQWDQPAATPAPATPAPTTLPADLAAKVVYFRNRSFQQTSIAPLDEVINALAKYPGFEAEKDDLARRRWELKELGLPGA
jgi:hypothetical protein